MEEEYKVSQLLQGHLAQECCAKSGEKGNGAKNKDQMHVNLEGDINEDKEENIFVQNKKSVINQNYLLLNNQSIINQAANASLVKNIRKLDKLIIVHCYAGSTKPDLVGELGKMTLHNNPNSIANLLSLKSVAARQRMMYDSNDRRGVFQVHTPGGIVEFKPSEQGLHYLDMSQNGETIQHMLVAATTANEQDENEDKSEDDP
jgi:hypothetical protein